MVRIYIVSVEVKLWSGYTLCVWRSSCGQDIHCVCRGQARIKCRCVSQDFIFMDDLFLTPESGDICVKVQYIQSAIFPAGDHSVCCIADRREDES